MRRTAKYKWQDYRTKEDVLSELKINPVLNKTQNYRTKWVRHGRQMDRDKLPHLIMKYQPFEKRCQGRPQMNVLSILGPEQVTRAETLQAM